MTETLYVCQVMYVIWGDGDNWSTCVKNMTGIWNKLKQEIWFGTQIAQINKQYSRNIKPACP